LKIHEESPKWNLLINPEELGMVKNGAGRRIEIYELMFLNRFFD